jgi:DNA (cytosine-5)-methyltransferase 1
MRKNSEILFNHVATRHTELVKNVISLVPEGGNYKNLPPGIGESRRFHEAWTRYHSQRPAKTITLVTGIIFITNGIGCLQ